MTVPDTGGVVASWTITGRSEPGDVGTDAYGLEDGANRFALALGVKAGLADSAEEVKAHLERARLRQLEEMELPENAPRTVSDSEVAALRQQIDNLVGQMSTMFNMMQQRSSNIDRPGVQDTGDGDQWFDATAGAGSAERSDDA
jgi:hypothetical protein